MNPYRYSLSLRLSHPTLKATDIESALMMVAKRSWSVGEPRSTPIGNPLEGTNAHTYCTFQLSEGADERLVGEIGVWNQKLLEKKPFFDEFSASGGETEYFLGLFLNGNSGFILPPEQMDLMRQLGIALSLDIYP
jgi:hypothetical protein